MNNKSKKLSTMIYNPKLPKQTWRHLNANITQSNNK